MDNLPIKVLDKKQKQSATIDGLLNKGVVTLGDLKEVRKQAFSRLKRFSDLIQVPGFTHLFNTATKFTAKHAQVMNSVTSEPHSSSKAAPRINQGFLTIVPSYDMPQINQMLPYGELTLLKFIGGINAQFLLNQIVCLHYWDIKALKKKILIVDCQQFYDLASIRKCYWSLGSLGVFDIEKYTEDHFLKMINYKKCGDLVEVEGTIKSIKQAGGQLYADIGTVIFIDPFKLLESQNEKKKHNYGHVEFANQLSSLTVRLGFTVVCTIGLGIFETPSSEVEAFNSSVANIINLEAQGDAQCGLTATKLRRFNSSLNQQFTLQCFKEQFMNNGLLGLAIEQTEDEIPF